jgi:hypothetical protein
MPKLRTMVVALVLSPLLFASAAEADAVNPPLGTAAGFAVLGASTVTNTGPTVITGDVGVSPSTAITGFPPGSITGSFHNGDPVATQAQGDIATAYAFAQNQACSSTNNLTGQDLGGKTLAPGVYCFDSSAQLTGLLKLDAQGSSTAKWLFQTTSTLTTASNAAVVLINSPSSDCNDNVTWQVGSSATIGSGSLFLGNILANISITLATSANSTGSLYAHTGAVTMDSNKVSTCSGSISPPPQLGIKTTPSGSVPAGGTISDSATVSGGVSPTGTVTFKLYGPGDPNCTGTVIATKTGTLNNQTASSGNVIANAGAGTYNWVATYNGDANNGSVTSPCGSEQVIVTAQRLTGRAYGLTAKATLAGLTLVNIVPTPDTGAVSTTSSSTTSTPCVASIGGLLSVVSAHVLCANVTTVAYPGKSTATASVADARVGITGLPVITMTLVRSTSTTTCAGSTGSTIIDYLKVGTTVVIGTPTTVAPNTALTVGNVSLVLNEQIPFHTPDDGLTVNAIHAKVDVLGLAQTNIVVASSESDIGNCPS